MENSMKTGIAFILLAGLLLSCEKGGSILHKVKYTTETVSVKSANAEPESIYSGLGNYITSITPRYFGAKMNILMYLDNWEQSNPSTHMISLLDTFSGIRTPPIFLTANVRRCPLRKITRTEAASL